jgi:polyferredoxin
MNATESVIQKLKKPDIQLYRKLIQYLFLAIAVLIGVKFTMFVSQLENGMAPTVTRPPGIEAFLPISSLISLKYWLVTGIFNPIHPSGLIIFLMALITAVLFKRGFCSWVCPFGLLTEYLNRLHKLIFCKDIQLPALIDYPLRSLKYLLLAYGVMVCMLFVGGSLIGRWTGNWQTAISNHEYVFHVKNLDMPFYQHNRGQTPAYNKDAWLRMMNKIREAGNHRQ